MTMEQDSGRLDLKGLPAVIHAPLAALVEALRSGLGDNLESITVVGSSVSGDFRAGASDINTVLVVRRQTMETLDAIAAMRRAMRKKVLATPLLMTDLYIERSRDVFGVEFLDFQLAHKTIIGKDPFRSLKCDQKDVRLQCERELKATLIRLRQGYVAAASQGRLVRDVLVAAAKGLAPLLRAMLWLKDMDRPATAAATYEAAGRAFDLDLTSLTTVRAWQYEKRKPDAVQLHQTFGEIYEAVGYLAGIVDELEV